MYCSIKKQLVENLTSLWSFIMKKTAKKLYKQCAAFLQTLGILQELSHIGLQTHVSRKQRFWPLYFIVYYMYRHVVVYYMWFMF